MSTPPPHSPTAIRPSKIARMDDSIDINDATTATIPVPSSVRTLCSLRVRVADTEDRYRPDAKARRYDRQLRCVGSTMAKGRAAD